MVNPEIIAAISCTHFPYSHQDTIPFLRKINDVYKPTLWVHLGDEGDYHSMSYHEIDPDLPSPGNELTALKLCLAELYDFIPNMYLMKSNHGSMVYRKAKTAGIPFHVLKSYKDYLGTPEGWLWKEHMDVVVNGKVIRFQHGVQADAFKASRMLSCSVVQGHLHTKFDIQYWGEPNDLRFSMQVGCLIDNNSLAMAYNKVTLYSPILGAGIIINGTPMLIPMKLNSAGRWIGTL